MNQPKYNIGDYCWAIFEGKIREAKIVGLSLSDWNGKEYYSVSLRCIENPLYRGWVEEDAIFLTKEELIESLTSD